jgi:hypothetical protein
MLKIDYAGIVAGVCAGAIAVGCFIIISLFCMCCNKKFKKTSSE